MSLKNSDLLQDENKSIVLTGKWIIVKLEEECLIM